MLKSSGNKETVIRPYSGYRIIFTLKDASRLYIHDTDHTDVSKDACNVAALPCALPEASCSMFHALCWLHIWTVVVCTEYKYWGGGGGGGGVS